MNMDVQGWMYKVEACHMLALVAAERIGSSPPARDVLLLDDKARKQVEQPAQETQDVCDMQKAWQVS